MIKRDKSLSDIAIESARPSHISGVNQIYISDVILMLVYYIIVAIFSEAHLISTQLFYDTDDGGTAESTKMGRSLILTGEKKPEKWLKVSCLLTGRTKTVRLFSLSVQERTTPPQLPELRTPSSTLEGRRVKRAGMPAGAEEAA